MSIFDGLVEKDLSSTIGSMKGHRVKTEQSPMRVRPRMPKLLSLTRQLNLTKRNEPVLVDRTIDAMTIMNTEKDTEVAVS